MSGIGSERTQRGRPGLRDIEAGVSAFLPASDHYVCDQERPHQPQAAITQWPCRGKRLARYRNLAQADVAAEDPEKRRCEPGRFGEGESSGILSQRAFSYPYLPLGGRKKRTRGRKSGGVGYDW